MSLVSHILSNYTSERLNSSIMPDIKANVVDSLGLENSIVEPISYILGLKSLGEKLLSNVLLPHLPYKRNQHT